jgi:hypothetical protein
MFSADGLLHKYDFSPKNGPVPGQPVNGYVVGTLAHGGDFGGGFCGYWTLEMFAIQPVRIYAEVAICHTFFHDNLCFHPSANCRSGREETLPLLPLTPGAGQQAQSGQAQQY